MDVEVVATVVALGIAVFYAGRNAWTRARRSLFAACTVAATDQRVVPERSLSDDEPLSADEWLTLLNDKADDFPHLAVAGTTGSGKTMFVRALLSRRAGRLVITTPKPASQDPWNNFAAVRLVYDPVTNEPSYNAIGDAIEAVYKELNWRGLRDTTGEPITLVVDELTTTINELRAVKRDVVPWLIAIWLRGRSAGIRLITMDPTLNVKGWGIEGRGDVRESIAFVVCQRGTRRAFVGELDEVRPEPERNAVELDTTTVLTLAGSSPNPAHLWVRPASDVGPSEHTAGPGERITPLTPFNPPNSKEVTPYEVVLVKAWTEIRDADGKPLSKRELARRLYAARGGDKVDYDGTGDPSYAVRAALEEAAAVMTL